MANAGQTCVAPDYVLLHEADVDCFVEAWGKAVVALYPDGPASADYTSIVNVRHYERLRGLLDDARAKGARVVETGPSPERAKHRAHTLPPTLVFDVRDDMRIMREEIFGPVLPIVTYRDLDEAIAFVNARPRPLGLYYFGSSAPNRRQVLTRTTSGGVTINGTLLHYVQDDLPFGGIGASGFGVYHGIEGFRAFSHQKAVFEVGRWNGGALLRPPFGRLTDFILSFMLRRARTTSGAPIEVRNAAVIHASIERVWGLLTDVERWPSWWRACRWVRLESPTRAASVVFRWKAHPVELRSAVVKSDRPHSFAITADATGVRAERTFTLRPHPRRLEHRRGQPRNPGRTAPVVRTRIPRAAAACGQPGNVRRLESSRRPLAIREGDHHESDDGNNPLGEQYRRACTWRRTSRRSRVRSPASTWK